MILALAVYVFMGIDLRPVRKAYWATMIALLSIMMLGMVMLIVSFLFDAGQNIMTINPAIIVNNLWTRGLVVVLGDFIRYKLIKSTNQQNRGGVIIALTVILAYSQMNALQMLLQGNVLPWAVFFEAIFRSLVISSTASYFSIKGSFLSVVLVSFTYTMSPYLLPILPDISPIVLSLIISGLLFVSAIIFFFFMNENKRVQQQQEKRAIRYAKKPIVGYIVTISLVGGIIAFFVGVFPVYPVVVLTSSMAGTFERGSLVFVERVPSGKAFAKVGEGEVIHFISHGGVEYIHRVVDFSHNTNGERQYITSGDASDFIDPIPVPQDDVLGIARTFLPFIGYPRIFFQSIVSTFR